MMNQRTKVYLQYPWKFPDSPYYKYLIDSPPEEIEFLNTKKQKGVITSKRFFWFSNFLKDSIRLWVKKLKLVIPNAHLSQRGNYDLIHCAHCLSKNTDKPWVADVEIVYSLFVSGGEGSKNNKRVLNLLKRNNCKKILPWTESTKNEILSIFPEIKNKVEVVYPAIPIQKFKKKKNKKLKIIYTARYFWIKGGLVALEILSQLKEKYDLDIVFVSSKVPKEIKKKYPEIEIQDLIPHKKMIQHFKEADIFFYPSFLDTFGFSFLEAMSFGVPVVTVNTGGTKACKEIIENKKTGLVIDFPHYVGNEIYSKCHRIEEEEKELIKRLVKKMSELIENKELREKMSKNCLKEIKSGKFSIKKRNKKLKRIYEEALKK